MEMYSKQTPLFKTNDPLSGLQSFTKYLQSLKNANVSLKSSDRFLYFHFDPIPRVSGTGDPTALMSREMPPPLNQLIVLNTLTKLHHIRLVNSGPNLKVPITFLN